MLIPPKKQNKMHVLDSLFIQVVMGLPRQNSEDPSWQPGPANLAYVAALTRPKVGVRSATTPTAETDPPRPPLTHALDSFAHTWRFH